eukprot:scaffold110015_cov36-Tisochrysis_lutea.AAC.2
MPPKLAPRVQSGTPTRSSMWLRSCRISASPGGCGADVSRAGLQTACSSGSSADVICSFSRCARRPRRSVPSPVIAP